MDFEHLVKSVEGMVVVSRGGIRGSASISKCQ